MPSSVSSLVAPAALELRELLGYPSNLLRKLFELPANVLQPLVSLEVRWRLLTGWTDVDLSRARAGVLRFTWRFPVTHLRSENDVQEADSEPAIVAVQHGRWQRSGLDRGLTAQVRAPADQAELERRLGRDSSNSGRPPSPNSISDEDETKTIAWDRSSRRRGVRMPGERPGATSITLPLVDGPYGTISCPPAERAGRGGGSGRSVNVR